MAIKAKIANVLSDYEVAFNAGAEAGVVKGSIALTFRDTEITDPDTGEPLGVVRRPQVRFEVSEVQPKLSVGRTTGSVRKPASGTIFLSALQEQPERIRVTTDPKQGDYRTWVIALGAEVEILPPPPQEK